MTLLERDHYVSPQDFHAGDPDQSDSGFYMQELLCSILHFSADFKLKNGNRSWVFPDRNENLHEKLLTHCTGSFFDKEYQYPLHAGYVPWH